MGSVGVDRGFVTCRDGIFKLIQFIICIIILIVTSASNYDRVYVLEGSGEKVSTGQMAYVNFVAAFGAVTLLISYIIYFLKLYNMPLCGRLPWTEMELVYGVGMAVLSFISIAVAGYSSDSVSNYIFTPNLHGLFAAAAIFSAILMLVYLGHVFLIFRGDPPRSAKDSSHSVNT